MSVETLFALVLQSTKFATEYLFTCLERSPSWYVGSTYMLTRLGTRSGTRTETCVGTCICCCTPLMVGSGRSTFCCIVAVNSWQTTSRVLIFPWNSRHNIKNCCESSRNFGKNEKIRFFLASHVEHTVFTPIGIKKMNILPLSDSIE